MIIKEKRKVRRTIKRIAITALVLLVLFVGGGIAYVYYTGQNTDPNVSTTPKIVEEKDPLPKPVQPSPNAPVGAAINFLSSPVKPGENASITVRTNATSTCEITVTYNDVKSTDSGLTKKTADSYGNVTWSWTVGTTVPEGKHKVQAVCTYHGRTGMVIGDLVVSNKVVQ